MLNQSVHFNRRKIARGALWLAVLIWAGIPCLSKATNQAVRIGHFPNLTHAQAVLARANGQFAKAMGAPVRWYSFNAGPSAIEALFTDAVDLSYVGPNPAINGFIRSRGEKFVIIAGAASGGAGLVVRKDSGILSEKDFHDRTIATPQLGNTQDVAARTWFMGRGYRLKEKGGRLTLIALSNPDQLTLFQKRQIDGAWTVEPWLSRLEVEGGGTLFLDEKDLWPGGRYVTTHLVARKAFVARHRALVKELLRAHVTATLEIRGDPVAAGKVLNQELAKETGKALRSEVVESAMKRIEFTWDPVRTSLYESAASAHSIGFIRKKPDLTGIYDLTLLNEVLSEMNLPQLD